MSAVTNKFPTTYAELLQMGGSGLTYLRGTYEDYWNLLKVADYNADFYRNKIIAMSYENEIHSKITTTLLGILAIIIYPRSARKFDVHDPNRPVYVNDCEGHAIFNPDGSVNEKPAVLHEYSKGMNATANPILVFEVLSPSTRAYDRGTKLPCYKEIDTLQYIIYLEAESPKVYFIERLDINQWRETIYTKPTDSFILNGQPITLEDIYMDIHF